MVCCGYCCDIKVAYLGALVTLLDSFCYDGVSAVEGVQHTGGKSVCKLDTLFDSYCYVGAVKGIQHTSGGIFVL